MSRRDFLTLGFLTVAFAVTLACLSWLVWNDAGPPPRRPVPPISHSTKYVANWESEEWVIEFFRNGECHAYNGQSDRWNGRWQRRDDLLCVEEWNLETGERSTWTVILDYNPGRQRFEGRLIDDIGRRCEFSMADMNVLIEEWLDEQEGITKK